MTADVKNTYLGLFVLVLWTIIMKATKSDQVKQTHFYIDVINVHRLLANIYTANSAQP